MADPDYLDGHLKNLINFTLEGSVVPFLGAGVNLYGRPEGARWDKHGSEFLPSGTELSTHLATRFNCPVEEGTDLVRVSEYASLIAGSGPLYEELHRLFDHDYQPTELHDFFASVPSILREKTPRPEYQLIVTTNYDDVLERAFLSRNEPFDLVVYVADGGQRGKFQHVPPDGPPRIVEKPNEYRDLSLERRPIILKIHGAVDRSVARGEGDSFVITEDHYIDYLTRTDLSNLVPVTLAAKLRRSHFLFLGYGLKDWNLRVILHRIAGEQKLTYKSWAIQLNPTLLDKEFWKKRDVEIFEMRLEEYITMLRDQIRTAPAVS